MFTILAIVLVALFLALFFLNLYFRLKVMQTHRRLVQNRVEFGAGHIFNKGRMEREILPKYPHMKTDILAFSHHIRFSLKIAVLLVLLISLIGMILMINL